MHLAHLSRIGVFIAIEEARVISLYLKPSEGASRKNQPSGVFARRERLNISPQRDAFTGDWSGARGKVLERA